MSFKSPPGTSQGLEVPQVEHLKLLHSAAVIAPDPMVSLSTHASRLLLSMNNAELRSCDKMAKDLQERDYLGITIEDLMLNINVRYEQHC